MAINVQYFTEQQHSGTLPLSNGRHSVVSNGSLHLLGPARAQSGVVAAAKKQHPQIFTTTFHRLIHQVQPCAPQLSSHAHSFHPDFSTLYWPSRMPCAFTQAPPCSLLAQWPRLKSSMSQPQNKYDRTPRAQCAPHTQTIPAIVLVDPLHKHQSCTQAQMLRGWLWSGGCSLSLPPAREASFGHHSCTNLG